MIFVVRHGRTASNASGLLLGRADPALDDVGRRQARQLSEVLGPVDLIVSSPLARTRQTAACLDGPVVEDDRWLELDYGDWDERPLSEITAEEWAAWRSDPHFAPPGGESLVELGRRVRDGLDSLVDELSEAPDRRVVVVTHVSPIKSVVGTVLGADETVAWRLFVAPASITRVRVNGDSMVLAGFNDISHLV
ncbi:MAG TPA: histidine phosphatase family protein [Microthrixaceae bacterium]|nr:histidine phosphatase family protein [Microthrixaceae bacterium]